MAVPQAWEYHLLYCRTANRHCSRSVAASGIAASGGLGWMRRRRRRRGGLLLARHYTPGMIPQILRLGSRASARATGEGSVACGGIGAAESGCPLRRRTAAAAAFFTPPSQHHRPYELIINRSCYELEPQLFDFPTGLFRKPTIPVGILPPTNLVTDDDEPLPTAPRSCNGSMPSLVGEPVD
uniref:Uncharacterized protein n=1 Tax=Oryza glumipatula TaxID=40148 RepID=A0A0E0AAC3_9ORYZ